MPKYLIVKSNIKYHAKADDKPLSISADFYEKLNEKAASLIREACKRAKENNRNTVMGRDI